nr:MAG TPA: hypothetical protein [Crassvirales sp.]
MTREDVIRLSYVYAASNGNLNSSDASVLLLSYCLENGKPYIESARFVMGLSRRPGLLAYCISYALMWYEKKYAICKLYSAPNPKVLNNKRRIILIY